MKYVRKRLSLLAPYVGIVILGIPLILYAVNAKNPQKFPLNFKTFILVVIVFLITSLPFILLNIYANQDNKRIVARSIVVGVVWWVYIAAFPGLLVGILKDPLSPYLFGIIEFLISVYLIYKYKFPKALAIVAIFLSTFVNLYLLIYGPIRLANNKY